MHFTEMFPRIVCNNSLCILMRKYQIYLILKNKQTNKQQRSLKKDKYCEHNIEYTHLVVIHYAIKHNHTVLLINAYMNVFS